MRKRDDNYNNNQRRHYGQQQLNQPQSNMFGMQQQLGQNQQPLNLFGNQNNLEKAPEKTPEEIEKQKRKRGKTCKIHRRDARKRSICNKDP